MTDRARPGLVALYDIRPGNGVGQFLQLRSPHGAVRVKVMVKVPVEKKTLPLAPVELYRLRPQFPEQCG